MINSAISENNAIIILRFQTDFLLQTASYNRLFVLLEKE